MLTPDGEKPIEQFRPGDRILAKAENDLASPVRIRTGGEVFELEGMELELPVGGQFIETTSEHPLLRGVPRLGPSERPATRRPLLVHDERITSLTSITRTDAHPHGPTTSESPKTTPIYFVGNPKWRFSI